jgi:hypothetical protein
MNGYLWNGVISGAGRELVDSYFQQLNYPDVASREYPYVPIEGSIVEQDSDQVLELYLQLAGFDSQAAAQDWVVAQESAFQGIGEGQTTQGVVPPSAEPSPGDTPAFGPITGGSVLPGDAVSTSSVALGDGGFVGVDTPGEGNLETIVEYYVVLGDQVVAVAAKGGRDITAAAILPTVEVQLAQLG